MQLAAFVILTVLAVVGAAAVLRELALRLFCGGAGETLFVTRLPRDSEQLEFALRGALARQRWSGARRSIAVCVDELPDEQTRKICEGICRQYGFGVLMTKEEFIKSLDYCGQDRV